MPGRRALALVVAGLSLHSKAPRAQGTGPAAARVGDFWFDPTQLPSFTGTVERYLLNPQGQTDALLFREGPQIVFPPDMAEALRQASPPGRPLIVWGIRARSAPVITMLAFAPNTESAPRVVERPYWRLGGRDPQAQAQRLAVAGTVRQPYFSPQGEIVGAVLDDGSVVLLPQGVAGGADRLRDMLKAGAKLAAEGPGSLVEAQQGGSGPARALVADRLGEAPDALRPLPAPAAARQ
ncbi:MAG: hypothetical protein K2X74_13490 [Acetobacteraceae bacterium]|nr:hypothetical protein [Acetobacteraceae bacterium]